MNLIHLKDLNIFFQNSEGIRCIICIIKFRSKVDEVRTTPISNIIEQSLHSA